MPDKKSRAAQMLEIMKARETGRAKPVIQEKQPAKRMEFSKSETEESEMMYPSASVSSASSLASLEKSPEPSAKPEKFSFRGVLYRKLKNKGQLKIKEAFKIPKRVAAYPKFTIVPQAALTSISSIKEAPAKTTLYPLIKPYAYASITHDPVQNELVYHVIEPELSEYERHVLGKLKDGLMQVINVSLEDIKKHDKMIDFLESNVRILLGQFDFHLDDKSYLKIMYYISRDFIGLNEIEPLLRDPYIEDIGADGIGIPVYVVHQRYGSLRTNIVYNDEKEMKEFVTKLAERSDRYISYAEPLLDGTLPDGTRVHATLAGDVTTRGPTFSIRKFRETPFTPVDIVRLNTASAEMLAYLWFLVENGANILITGGVATGKTSFLNTLSMFIPPEAKVVSIEDTRELSLPHENWIPGVARVGFTGTGVGEVSMFDLLKESFRENPDYLIVGEIRGKEAYVMFQSMASGHPSMSTMHAGSVDDVVKRLQTEPINISPGLLDALDMIIVMIHAREKGKSARRVKELIEVESIDSETGRPRTSKVFVWLPSVDSFEYRGDSWILHKLSTEKGMSMNLVIREIARRKKVINWLVENNITQLSEIVKYTNMYHRDPDSMKHILGETY
ncbi:MAG: type II/IV secretion system ATPase subunit [Candidatus Aenigmarchaeota archaeon]|nr:type II/IV secretion system ATPase subunit [Candidatus Aenigmarchaeota archaeon]